MRHPYLFQKHKFLTGKNIFFAFPHPFFVQYNKKKDPPQLIVQLYGGALFEIN